MMTPNTNVRVSILERLVPSFAFAVAAISGAIGGVMMFRFLRSLWKEESAGLAAFFAGIVEMEVFVGAVLVIAAVLCAIGIIVSIIRLFTTNTTASPPGILFLMTGLLSLVPAFALHYVLHLMKGVAVGSTPVEGGVSAIADTVRVVSYFAIGSAGLIALALLAFSFIPFTSRPGRKSSPLICLMLVELVIVVLIGLYFWEARISMEQLTQAHVRDAEAERDHSESSSEFLEPHNYNSDPGIVARPPDNTYGGAVDTNSGSRPKTISGGILNDKAIELPQPPYPPAARAVRASGSVSVQVTVDEKGEVTSATAVSGHPLLRSAAVQAARSSKFSPTMLSGQPVKVTGVIVYNFVP